MLLSFGWLHAATPELLPLTGLSLNVITVATKKVVLNRFKTNYGSYDKDTIREREVEIVLSNLGRNPYDVKIVTHFIGKSNATNARLVLRTREEVMQVRPNTTCKLAAESGLIGANDLNLQALGIRDISGARIEGWIVIVSDSATGKMLCCRASQSHLDILARTPGELEKLPSGKK